MGNNCIGSNNEGSISSVPSSSSRGKIKTKKDFWNQCYTKREWKQSLKVGDMIDVLNMDKNEYISYKIIKLNTSGDCTLYLEREYKGRKNNKLITIKQQYNIPNWNFFSSLFPYQQKSDYKDENINTLSYNIANGNDIILKKMIESNNNEYKIDVNEINPKYSTPLICALNNDQPNIALLLLNEFKNEINVNLKDNYRSPLGICCDKKYHHVILKLFSFKDLSMNANGKPCIAYCAYKQNMKTLTFLLEHYDDITRLDINEMDRNGHTAIYYACLNRNINALNLLLENKDSDPNISISGNGCDPPINIAIRNDYDDIIQRLLEYNDNVEPINFNFIGLYKENCLMLLCKQGNIELIKQFLDYGGDVTIRNGNKSLMYYTMENKLNENEQLKIIKLLLSHPNTRITGDDLCFAIKKNKKKIFKLLLNPIQIKLKLSYINEIGESYRDSKTNVNVYGNITSWSPLYTAVSYGHSEIVKLLIEYGANLEYGTKSKPSETAIAKAAKLGNSLSLYYLLNNGASYDIDTFFLSLQSGDGLCVKYLYEYDKTVIGDINIRHKVSNLTPLMVAVRSGKGSRSNNNKLNNPLEKIGIDSKMVIIGYLREIKKEYEYINIPNIIVYLIDEYSVADTILNLLFKYDANVLLKVPNGSTILNESIRFSDSITAFKEIINELQQRKYNKREDLINYIYKYDKHNKNALNYGVENKRTNIVKLLIDEYDANIFDKDKSDKYLHEIACNNGNYGVSEYIMKRMYEHNRSTKIIQENIKKTREEIKKKKHWEYTHRPRCFDGDGKVLMNDGTYKLISDLCIGDHVKTLINGYSKIKCIQISEINRSVEMVYIYNDYDNGFWITFEHPILLKKNNNNNHDILKSNNIKLRSLGIDDISKYNLKWELPKNINNVEWRYQDKLYNFVLENNHTLNVNGFWCITLGHDFKGYGIQHEFYGNSKAIDLFLRTSATYPISVFQN